MPMTALSLMIGSHAIGIINRVVVGGKASRIRVISEQVVILIRSVIGSF